MEAYRKRDSYKGQWLKATGLYFCSVLTIPNFGRNPPIPVTFTHQGKEYKGIFSEIMGAGGYTWHLSVNNYYRGCMSWVQYSEDPRMPVNLRDIKYKLRFNSQKGDLDYLESEFIDLLIAWYQ